MFDTCTHANVHTLTRFMCACVCLARKQRLEEGKKEDDCNCTGQDLVWSVEMVNLHMVCILQLPSPL